MAFDRKISLAVGADGSGFELADLDLSFDIRRSYTASENQGAFRIFNANENSRKELLREGNNVVFKAGYADQAFGTLFVGNIVQATSKHEGVDWITDILAYSSRATKVPAKKTPLALSYAPGVLFSTVIREVGKTLDLVVTGAENAEIPLLNGFTFAGLPGTFFTTMSDWLALFKVGIFVDNNEIVIFQLDGSSSFSAVLLNEKSGLIYANDITEGETLQNIRKTKKKGKKKGASEDDIVKKKVAFKSLIDPNIRPNGLVDIQGQSVQGIFLVEKTHMYGDNFGGDFACEGIGSV